VITEEDRSFKDFLLDAPGRVSIIMLKGATAKTLTVEWEVHRDTSYLSRCCRQMAVHIQADLVLHTMAVHIQADSVLHTRVVHQ
jgi:hypothetical protein